MDTKTSATRIETIPELPTLNSEEFFSLPANFENKTFLIFESKWNHAEEEAIAALILTIIARKGKWEPVSFNDFDEIINTEAGRNQITLSICDNFIQSLRSIIESGDFEIKRYQNMTFFIPTPIFTETLKKCRLYLA